MKYILGLILIVFPGIYGYLAHQSMIPFYPLIAQIVFLIYWLWVGYIIGRFSKSSMKGLFLGNSVWLISLVLFIWQFVLTDEVGRLGNIAAIPQYYILPFVWLASKFAALLTMIDGSTIIILTFICMLVVFVSGFRLGKK
ncbi:hypothetical protein ACQKND_19095 [Viridibacillus arvi]|uniref:hypothetical protein n=1 Tax=Viridibacillus arvi TaxID=263475 RepID=UPI003CFC7FC5